MEFSRQEYGSRLPFPASGDLLNPGIEPASLLHLLRWQVDSLSLNHLGGKPHCQGYWSVIFFSCGVLVRFWYQCNAGLVKWIWKHSLLSDFFVRVEKTDINSVLSVWWVSPEKLCSPGLCWEVFGCWFSLLASNQSVQIFHVFTIHSW